MKAKQDPAKKTDRDSTGRYLSEMGRTAVLSRDDETAVGMRMHAARASIAEALCGSREALKEIAILGQKLEAQKLSLADISDVVDDEDFEEATAEIAFFETLSVVTRCLRAREALPMETFRAIRLSAGTVSRIIATVRRTPTTDPKLLATRAALGAAEREFTSARNWLVQCNLRLVIGYAKVRVNRGLDFQDLIQEGNGGLVRAASKFDHTKGFKFSTYAMYWVRQSIDRALHDQSRTIRIPVHLGDKLRNVRCAKGRLEMQGIDPTPEAIAKEADIGVDAVRQCLALHTGVLSLNKPTNFGDESGDGEFGDSLPGEAPSQHDIASERQIAVRTRALLECLLPREREIVQRRFGIDRKGEETLEAIGESGGVTRERVRQIEVKALQKLRHPARARELAELGDAYHVETASRAARA